MNIRPNQSQIDSTMRRGSIASLYSERLSLAASCKYRAANGLSNGDDFYRILPLWSHDRADRACQRCRPCPKKLTLQMREMLDKPSSRSQNTGQFLCSSTRGLFRMNMN